jgi:hypothetical protein
MGAPIEDKKCEGETGRYWQCLGVLGSDARAPHEDNRLGCCDCGNKSGQGPKRGLKERQKRAEVLIGLAKCCRNEGAGNKAAEGNNGFTMQKH